jgi:hypothetical protein
MKNAWLSRALWLAWHPLELLRLLLGKFLLGLLIVMSYANDAIDEGKK